MPVQIVEILERSIQGVTKPFLCRSEAGQNYFVKGRGGRQAKPDCRICGRQDGACFRLASA